MLPKKTNLCRWFLGALLLAATLPAGAADIKLDQLWSVNLNSLLETAAIPADLDGDGPAEILVAAREELFALDGHGKELWRWRTPGRFMTYPTAWVRPGQPALVYAADNAGNFTCLDGAGKVVWQAKLAAGSMWSASVLFNFDSDPALEVAQTDIQGNLLVFDAENGAVLAKAALQGTPVTPAVGASGARLYIATGEGRLFAYGPDGMPMDRSIGGPSPSWATAAPVAVGLGSPDRLAVVVPTAGGRLLGFDGKNEPLWDRPLRGAAASSVSAGDFDGDNLADVFVLTQLGSIYRFDETGRLLWDIDMQGRTLAPGAIVDIDGDGRLEFVLSTQDGHLMVLDQEGRIVFSYQFDNRTINATPAFADVDPASPGLELVITGGESGRLFCFSTSAPVDAAAPWRMYRGNVTNAGLADVAGAAAKAARMAPQKLAWDALCTGDDVVFDIEKAKDDAEVLLATAACVRPDGARQVATARVLRRKGALRLPTAIVAPGLYRFTWSVAAPDGKVLDSGARDVTFQPFARDRALVVRALDALDTAAREVEKDLPASAAALRREATLLEAAAAELRETQDRSAGGGMEGIGEVVEKSAAVVAQARRALALTIVRYAVAGGPNTSLIASEGDPWESRGVDGRIPQEGFPSINLERRVVPGEHEPVAVDLFNVTDRELQVRVLVDRAANYPKITLHRAVPVPTAQGATAWDPLPEFDESAVVSIPSLSSRQVWVDADFTGVAPGDYVVRVRFLAMNGVGVVGGSTAPQDVPAPEATATLKFKVLPFDMAAPGVFRLCAWATLDEAAIADLLAHGNNVFCVPLPEVKRDAQGKLAPSDFSKTDAILRHLKGHDVMVLLTHQPALSGKPGSPEYAAELKPYLDEIVAHLAEYGFDTDHTALYPIDEPGGNGWNAVNAVVEFGTAVKAARPDVMVYVDGGGEGPMFEAMSACVDIWTPSIYQLPEDSPEMRVMRKTGRMLWSYNCSYNYARPAGPNIKDINVVAEFRNAALFALQYGATGIGFWCYNIGADPWGRVKDEYVLVYPGADGPVTSRRWEAVRESIEDYRILAALRARKDLAEPARAAVDRLFDTTIPGIIEPSYQEMRQGFSRDAIDAGNNAAGVARFRGELLDAVEAATPAP